MEGKRRICSRWGYSLSDEPAPGTSPAPKTRLPAMGQSRSFLLLAATFLAGCGDAARVPPIPNGSTALATCTRCHGDAANGNAAPPVSVRGESDTAAIGVGAHQSHLKDSTIRQAL